MNDTILIAQQFGPAAGETLRRQLPGLAVLDVEAGPAGWRPDIDVLFSGPTPAWRGKARPPGWPGRLRWIQLPSTGIDGYPQWLFEVPCVTTAPGLNASTIAEFAIAAMLGHEKRFPEVWIRGAEDWKPRAMGTLNGRTLALGGIGAIGTAVARHALAFGMRVVALRRSPVRPMEGVDVVTDPRALAPVADHLVLCMPSTADTRHLVDAEFLAACKPGLHLVNVARGDLVDQDALLRALDDGTVARASLDVTSPEPLPAGHALYRHPRVHLSPHLAWNAPDTLQRLLDLFTAQVKLFAAGQEPKFRCAPPTPTHPG